MDGSEPEDFGTPPGLEPSDDSSIREAFNMEGLAEALDTERNRNMSPQNSDTRATPPIPVPIPTQPVVDIHQKEPLPKAKGRPAQFFPDQRMQKPPSPVQDPLDLVGMTSTSREIDTQMEDAFLPSDSISLPVFASLRSGDSPLDMDWRNLFDPRRGRQMYRNGYPSYMSYPPIVPTAHKFKYLGARLAGVIMGCTDDTKDECLRDLIFGLPEKHWEYLQHVGEGMTFYLFNYSRRCLHGVFKSTEPAKYKLNPYGWCTHQNMETPFPAQIKVQRTLECPPLIEGEFGQVISYIDNTKKFSFELDSEQVEKLNRMFEVTSRTDPHRQEPSLPFREFVPYERRNYRYGRGSGRRGGYVPYGGYRPRNRKGRQQPFPLGHLQSPPAPQAMPHPLANQNITRGTNRNPVASTRPVFRPPGFEEPTNGQNEEYLTEPF